LERLACYDHAAGRDAVDPSEADASAERARQALEADRQAAIPVGSDESEGESLLFSQEDEAYRDSIANVGRGSLLDSRWELARDSKRGIFNFRAYKPVYLLPAFWTSDINNTPQSENPDNTVDTPQDLQNTEAKFQISFKTKFAENLFGDNGDLWGAYTQSSRWQVYNGD